MNWEVSALACFALFTDCLIKKKYLASILPSSKYLFQKKKKLCVIADVELLSKFMCGAVSEYFGWKISSHPAEMLGIFGAKINEYLFNRASLSSWCWMFETENA